MKLSLPSLESIQEAAISFLANIADYKIIAFYGDMGVGKTTFIKALCKELDVIDTVSSPTFSLVNEYKTKESNSIYHFDFYRINSIEEVYDLGYEEYFYSGNICFIEWPELIEELMPENCLKVRILENQDGSRTIEI
ncbi:tRNA (adenosine(37)-N6)-threonylcarbamoyltransferase complex ATPase subunit type 1 TsaE [Bacteroidota bacterium]